MERDTMFAQQECVSRAPCPQGESRLNEGKSERWWWCALLCVHGVTDVRGNVWVVRRLARSPGGASSVEHLLSTLPVPYIPTSPTSLAGREAKWCEAASSPTSSITPPQPIPPARLSAEP